MAHMRYKIMCLLAIGLCSWVSLSMERPSSAATTHTIRTVLIEPERSGHIQSHHGTFTFSKKLKILDTHGRPLSVSQINYPAEVRLTYETHGPEDHRVTVIQLLEARR